MPDSTPASAAPTSPAAPSDPLEASVRGGLQRIRAGLTELYASVGADPNTPQVVSREVGINRNLAWKLSRILGADDPLAAIEHLPGSGGVSIMLEAFENAGAPALAVEEVRGAIVAFDEVVAEHVGDRATLDLVVGSMLPPHLQVERDRVARRMAFQGNSATWGIQADVHLSSTFYAPAADDASMIDVVSIGGLLNYRRLRRGIRWPLLRVNGFQSDGEALRAMERRIEPLDPGVPRGDAPLLPAFCTGDQPPIERRSIPGGQQFEIADGPLGNRGATTSLMGYVNRSAASCYADEHNEHGELLVHWFTPVTDALVDLVVHRDLPLQMPPELRVSGRMGPVSVDPILSRGLEPLPLAEPVRSLGAGPPRLATPLVPRYREMTDLAFARMGWDPADFVAYRLHVPFPPIPTMCVLRFALGGRPGG